MLEIMHVKYLTCSRLLINGCCNLLLLLLLLHIKSSSYFEEIKQLLVYVYILKNLSSTILFNQFKCNGKRQLKAGLIQVVKQLK